MADSMDKALAHLGYVIKSNVIVLLLAIVGMLYWTIALKDISDVLVVSPQDVLKRVDQLAVVVDKHSKREILPAVKEGIAENREELVLLRTDISEIINDLDTIKGDVSDIKNRLNQTAR